MGSITTSWVNVQSSSVEAAIGEIEPLRSCRHGLRADALGRIGGRGLRTLRNQARHQLPMVMGLPASNQKNQHVTDLLLWPPADFVDKLVVTISRWVRQRPPLVVWRPSLSLR